MDSAAQQSEPKEMEGAKLTHDFTLEGHEDKVWTLAWQPIGQNAKGPGLLASASSDKKIKIWQFDEEKNQWSAICTIDEGHTKTVRHLSWSPQGNLLASASFDGTACIWRKEVDAETGQLDFVCVQQLQDHQNEVKAIDWSLGGDYAGQYLASCSRDKTVYIYEADSQEMLLDSGNAADVEFEFSVNAILSGHAQDIKFVKWHPHENYLFSASYDNTIKCWKYDESVDDWLCSFTMNGHLSTVWQIDFDPTGNYLCSCSEDKTWSIWRIHLKEQDFANLGIIMGSHMRSVYSLSWSKAFQKSDDASDPPAVGCDLVATGGADNRLNVYQINR